MHPAGTELNVDIARQRIAADSPNSTRIYRDHLNHDRSQKRGRWFAAPLIR